MSFLSKIVPTFFSASNENTLALASAKFDFSLIKLEAPVEFGPLGVAISKGRKHEAEDGGSHRTARRLGALFEQIIPSTPKLIGAYGKRVSEIINKPGVNPEGHSSHGPFRDYVGVDATAIWAAATSGISSIAMYMLACLIAQLLDHKQAVSLWVEIVAERRSEIQQQSTANYNISESTFHSAHQEISRQDLAIWDNSARAWLRSGDEAKSYEKKQLQLIVENLSIPHRSGANTYQKVIGSWLEAMQGVEDLMNGMPQEVHTKSIPLALLAWHLFPNLLVLSAKTKHISFKDTLFPPSATLTLGALTLSEELPVGSKWSLALSHFQYYGSAVQVRSEEDASRVTVQEASVISFGALMAVWNSQAFRINGMKGAATWLATIFRKLRERDQTPYQWSRDRPSDPLSWLCPISEAAEEILQENNQDRLDDLLRLYRFGQRRYRNFLTNDMKHVLPFFGLRNEIVLSSLSRPVGFEQAQIEYLKQLAQRLGHSGVDSVIVHRQNRNVSIISTCPINWNSGKRNHGGTPRGELRSWRWTGRETHQISAQRPDRSSLRLELEPDPHAFLNDAGQVSEGPSELVLCDGVAYLELKTRRLQWLGPPKVLLNRTGPDHLNDGVSDSQLLELGFDLVEGNTNLGLYFHGALSRHPRSREIQISDIMEQKMSCEPFEASAHSLQDVSRELLAAYLRSVIGFEHDVLNSNLSLPNHGALQPLSISALEYSLGLNAENEYNMGSDYQLSPECAQSLRALWFARTTFHQDEGSIVSTKVFGGPTLLGGTQWSRWRFSEIDHWRSRPIALACVVYMDSGTLDLEIGSLQNAVAVSRENCMYVISNLLEDPYIVSRRRSVKVQRLVGNLGRSGTSILVAPSSPMVRKPGLDIKTVNHELYDFARQDNFTGTSLHLQFSEWTFPIDRCEEHSIDAEAQYVEAIIKVRDRGGWVADLDVLAAFDTYWLPCEDDLLPCPGETEHHEAMTIISVDNWEELLDPPSAVVCVFRAHGNWAARLAALSILTQRGFADRTVVAIEGSEKCAICQRRGSPTHSEKSVSFIID